MRAQLPPGELQARLQGLLNLRGLPARAFLEWLLCLAFAEPRDAAGRRLRQART